VLQYVTSVAVCCSVFTTTGHASSLLLKNSTYEVCCSVLQFIAACCSVLQYAVVFGFVV